MANKQINDFTLKSPPAGTDEILLQETGGGTTKKTTLEDAKSFAFQQIASETLKSPIVDTDEFLIQETGGGSNKKVLASAISSYIASGSILHGTIGSLAADTDHDITISIGTIPSSDYSQIITLSSPITKQIDATWAAGDNSGGLFSGTVANNTEYYMFLIVKDSDGSVDAGFDTSITAANIPAGYTAYALVHWVLTDGSANIIAHKAYNNGNGSIHYQWSSIIEDADSTIGATSALLSLSVPTGFSVLHEGTLSASAANTGAIRLSNPDLTDAATSATYNTAQADVVLGTTTRQRALRRTDTSRRLRIVGSAAGQDYALYTHGFIWHRH